MKRKSAWIAVCLMMWSGAAVSAQQLMPGSRPNPYGASGLFDPLVLPTPPTPPYGAPPIAPTPPTAPGAPFGPPMMRPMPAPMPPDPRLPMVLPQPTYVDGAPMTAPAEPYFVGPDVPRSEPYAVYEGQRYKAEVKQDN